MSDEAEVLSASIEAAKSGRAKCRRCRQTIAKGELRLGEQVDNPYGEGDATLWYHLACGTIKRPAAFLVAEQTFSEEIPERAQLTLLAQAGERLPCLCQLAAIEAAPSGRARCQQCRELIEKGALRLVRHNDADLMAVPTSSYIHLDCALKYAQEAEGGDAGTSAADLRVHLEHHLQRLEGELEANARSAVEALFTATES
ncbi:MAG: hypothetical protein H6718_36660 [Polyangiaceae bacterium]|nr:hypothetical protein [Myxococcales bacterium]MCB9590995.1 hypothetical protein [Polyangiaceae bacterium]